MGDSIKLGTVKLETALVTEFIQRKITVAVEERNCRGCASWHKTSTDGSLSSRSVSPYINCCAAPGIPVTEMVEQGYAGSISPA